MICPFLVVAGHMWKVKLALASQVSKAKGLLIKARSKTCHTLKNRNQGGGRPCRAYVERHASSSSQLSQASKASVLSHQT
ncbi:hypothetical protein TIFTF001_034173 [Ficus carica]|uniref:Secreted protein n=1 Tax=Ficus carica TaxID=3494 RepID=A0AA88J8T1_FICCA|nr:hypothetical protein TIFTF001_034173 [Ficus carica]